MIDIFRIMSNPINNDRIANFEKFINDFFAIFRFEFDKTNFSKNNVVQFFYDIIISKQFRYWGETTFKKISDIIQFLRKNRNQKMICIRMYNRNIDYFENMKKQYHDNLTLYKRKLDRIEKKIEKNQNSQVNHCYRRKN